MVEKGTWTDADFEVMGWHDCPIRAVAVDLSEGVKEVALDLDYIVSWIAPEEPGGNFSFWISPATLLFHEVWTFEGDISVPGPFLELDGIEREADRSWTKWTSARALLRVVAPRVGFHAVAQEAP